MSRFDGGWFKLWRGAWEKDLSHNLVLWGLWNAILHMATWKDSQILWEGKQRSLPAGSVVLGMRELAERWECSHSTIKKWLHHLQETSRIRLETCPRGTLVTILNWDAYQGSEAEQEPQTVHSATTESPQTVHSATLSEEEKKLRREESKNKYSCRFDLESAYQRYPLKQGKTPGLKKLAKEIKTEEDFQSLLVAIDRYSRSKKVAEGYIKLFSTFASEWRDWIDETTGTTAVSITPVRDRELEELEAQYEAVRSLA